MLNSLRALRREPGIILILALGVALGFSLAANFFYRSPAPAVAAPARTQVSAEFRDVFSSISERLSPSVVNITSEKKVVAAQVTPPGLDDFFFGPFGQRPKRQTPQRKETQTATGSGVIVRADGYVITNDHVVGGADRVTVKLADGREFSGKVLRDPKTDLALVKIDATGLPAVAFADSENVRVGDWAIAIGNPFGFKNTVTVGVVSGLSREFYVPDETDPNEGKFYPDAIQTDASINPGNSGGPLVDIDGRLIGINSAIFSRSGGNIGLGFAVPSETVKFVMEQLISKGKVIRGYLGLQPSDLTPVLSSKLGTASGALVESVDRNSPAAKGGIEVKDVIVKIDGKPIRTALDLRRIVQAIAPGTTVKIVVVRDKDQKTLSVKVGEAPGSVAKSDEESSSDKIGLSVEEIDADKAEKLGLDADVKGVLVTEVEPGSPADRAGVRAGDVIAEIDDTKITSPAVYEKLKGQIKEGDTVLVVVYRGGRSTILEMQIE